MVNPFNKISLSLLIFLLGWSPLLVVCFLSYKFIILGHGWTEPATILSELGPLVNLVPTIIIIILIF